ncbi:hypothetical protein G4B84_006217 [Aspergillus flavus NRRL3357]|nr:uncharacterized protein G4B84_006217 [Aspergillus flavus NRRL3357]QMW30836.1 hypothetical protein G4B84_006217 [Aspergillus flavus NRRL3357]
MTIGSLNMPPKRKPETVTQEEVALTQSLADDEGHTTAGRTYLGDIAIHVDHLETDTYRNRERDEDHNARLVQTFTNVLSKHRAELPNSSTLPQNTVRSVATRAEGITLSDVHYVKTRPADCPPGALIQGRAATEGRKAQAEDKLNSKATKHTFG